MLSSCFEKDCIFCKIIQGEIKSFKIFEDEYVYSFMDINPIAPGHALVIPKFHAQDIIETPSEWIGKSFAAAGCIARAIQKSISPEGISIVQANGPGAKQSIFHLHVHVIPRSIGDELTMNWELTAGNVEEIRKLADCISANVV